MTPPTRSIQQLEVTRQGIEAYLLLKATERDWHGVADAAMDLRELEVELKIARALAK